MVSSDANRAAPVAYHRMGAGEDQWKTLRYENNKVRMFYNFTDTY